MDALSIVFEASLWGQLDGPGLPDAPLPRLANPTNHPDWTSTMFHIYPNLDIIVWKTGYITTYTYWPTTVDHHIYDARLYYQPPRHATDRLAQARRRPFPSRAGGAEQPAQTRRRVP